MKTLFYFFLFSFLLGCKNTSNKSSVVTKQTTKKDSSEYTLSIGLPEDNITKSEINKSVSEIDKLQLKGDLKSERIGGFNNGYCEIIKYFQDSSLVKIECGCGDCTNFMSTEKYYIKNNNLIFVHKNYIDYGYNPCWSDKDCKENGITEQHKKKILKTRTEKYYIFDMGSSFTRTGNLNDSLYVRNDTLTIENVLDDAIKYLNATE